ncbi:DoxX-like family protein [Alkalihalobacillus sp. TS-13]|uniref:DoxX-like family protein n=1 Tax=Alkalihalobacillus sp. TS-13 TaxID=2842455 RepID=UPI001C8840C8|nr:DoxX-like family protein [Alkalihalobacillus sp. TS-13]
MNKNKPIYVESTINTDMDRIWQATQDPEQHEQWDLRFTNITYLPKMDEDEPQRFEYKTNIGFGLSIAGEGESVGTKEDENAARTSSLKFWTDMPFSLIKKGGGYWKYMPTKDGIQFVTLYDYTTRFGAAGQLLDRFVFRPLMGWATAWSFDCLKLWLEENVHPKTSLLRSMMHWVICAVLAVVWIYQGLVPKLLFPDSGELAIVQKSGLFVGFEETVLLMIGFLEIAFGLIFLLPIKKKKVFYINVVVLLGLLAGAIFSNPAILVAPFNPIALTLVMVGLSVIGILNSKGIPSAKNCKRKMRGDES